MNNIISNSSIKVSIVIPVFNAEKYLARCLDSVINQTLKDIEIICINDCSTDKSLNILKTYASKDKRIKLINLPQNVGVGKARNIGIGEAKGEYIGFVDSDDFVDTDFYEKLYNKTGEAEADAVKGNIYDYCDITKTAKLNNFYDMNGKIRENFAYFYYGFTSAIYKKSFIDNFKINFPEGINYFEDPYFSIKACINYKKITFDNNAKYYYVKRMDSLSSDLFKTQNLKNFRKIAIDIIEHLNNSSVTKKDYNIIFQFLYDFILNNFYNKSIRSSLKDYMLDTIIEMLFAAKYQFCIPKTIEKKLQEKINLDTYNKTLLKYYKKYDYLNKDHTLIKIFVSYIKPSFLFKSEILTPIHLGRNVEKENSKDGNITDEDIKWLHENCIADNDFEGNISSLNRRIGFFTGTYWAWKNYEKLGNPKYFGSFGYRRLFFPNCLNNIEEYDFILPERKNFKLTLKSQMIRCHGELLYNVTLDTIKNIFPDEFKNVKEYFEQTKGYFAEIYIMKKDLFFDFCKWLIKIVEYLTTNYKESLYLSGQREHSYTRKLIYDFLYDGINELNFSIQNGDVRDFAFIIERLTGYYLYKLTQNKSLKYQEFYVPEPQNKLLENSRPLILNKMRQNIKKDMQNNDKSICNSADI